MILRNTTIFLDKLAGFRETGRAAFHSPNRAYHFSARRILSTQRLSVSTKTDCSPGRHRFRHPPANVLNLRPATLQRPDVFCDKNYGPTSITAFIRAHPGAHFDTIPRNRNSPDGARSRSRRRNPYSRFTTAGRTGIPFVSCKLRHVGSRRPRESHPLRVMERRRRRRGATRTSQLGNLLSRRIRSHLADSP